MTSTKRTILLIDDDPSLIHMYQMKFMREPGLGIVCADTAEKGLKAAIDHHPALILLDLVMSKEPGLRPDLHEEEGFGILRKLKSDPKTKAIPVVIFTNLDETEPGRVQLAKQLGALEYWVKANFQPSDVVKKVKEIVSQH